MSFGLRRKVFLILATASLVLVLFAVTQFATAALSPFPCSDGHFANEKDIAAGFPAGKYVCPNDYKTTGITPESGEAKQYLRSILCRTDGDNFGGSGPDGTITGLDSKLATCAARFLKAASSQLGGQLPLFNGGTNPVCVREGKRSVAKQEEYAQRYRRGGGIACIKGANCEHPRGVAIDVNTTSEDNYRKLHAAASRFGVVFYLGFRDKVHFVPNGKDCSAGGTAPFDFPSAASPAPPFDQALRKLLQQPPSPPPPQTTSPAATQPTLSGAPPIGTINTSALPPGTCIPQFYCSGSTYYYRSSSCVDQMYQTCQYGCADSTTCAANPTASSTNQNTNTNINSNGTGTTTYDLIGGYAGSGTTDIATATPITLNPNTGSPTMLQPPPQGPSYAPAGIVGVPPSPSQETFTSADLSGSSPFGTPQSAYFEMLNAIKNTVLGILNYLRPFGGTPSQIYID